MAISVPATVSVGTGDSAVVKQVDHTGTDYQKIEMDVTVGANQTDLQVNIAIDVSALKMICLLATANMTIETNSGSAAAQTFNLIANVPHFWQASSAITNPWTTDVTAFFVTNTTAGTLSIRVVQDGTG